MIDLPTPDQLERMGVRLQPLLRKLAGAGADQTLTVKFEAAEESGAVALTMSLKLDGQALPLEQEAKIGLFLQRVWGKTGVMK